MLDAIQIIENSSQHTFFEIIQQTEINFLAGFKNRFAQAEELLVGDAIIFERIRILRPAQSQERTDFIPQIFYKR